MGVWDVITDALGFGGPSGNDHGSSNWAAWGHPEIRAMLDDTVDPAEIYETAAVWRDQGRNTADVLTGFTRDLNGIVANGWCGAAADAALTALEPIEAWAASHAGTADDITRRMEDSGSAAAQAKARVPPPKSHSWMETLAVTALTGPVGGIADAVMQEREQSNAHAEAVRIMTNVYSAPINDHRAAVPTYPQLADPTVQPPEQAPTAGPAPGILYSAPGGPSAGAGGMGGAHSAHPPTPAALQGVTSGGDANPGLRDGGQGPPEQAARQPQHGSGQAAAIAAAATGAGVPITAPIAAAAIQRARPAGGGPKFGGGQVAGPHLAGGKNLGDGHSGGVGRAGAGHSAGFGPRPSMAAEIAEGRMGGLARGASAAAAERAGLGGLVPPLAAGGGKRGEDSEHRRPSYLIEMGDVFADGRKVAPAVIGEDPPGHGGLS